MRTHRVVDNDTRRRLAMKSDTERDQRSAHPTLVLSETGMHSKALMRPAMGKRVTQPCVAAEQNTESLAEGDNTALGTNEFYSARRCN